MEKHLVSIVIPAFNIEKFIGDCLDSIINQSYRNIEVIIIDDCSTDSTNEVIQQKIEKMSNLRCIYNKNNLGVGEVRNVGLNESHGEFILFLDGDDWVDTDFIKKMIEPMLIKKSDISISNTINEYGNFVSSTPRYFYSSDAFLTNDYALKLLSRSIKNTFYITPMVGCKLFRKDLLTSNNLKFINDSSYEDDIFSFLSFIYSQNIDIVSSAYQYYRQHPDSITHKFSKKRIDELVSAFVYLKKYLKDKDFLEKYKKEYNSFFERCIYTTYYSISKLKISTADKKNYIQYFINKMSDNFTIQDIIDYIDIERIEKFIGF